MADEIVKIVRVQTEDAINNVQKLNNELGKTDDLINQSSKDIGVYGGAFEEAFKTGIDQVGKLSPELKGMSGTITKMIPLIKKVNNVAIAGLDGIKGAIASTGVGALIIAAGLLVNKLIEMRNKAKEAAEAEIEAQKKIQEELDKSNEKRDKQLQQLREAIGLSKGEAYEALTSGEIAGIKKLTDAYVQGKMTLEEVYAEIEKTSEYLRQDDEELGDAFLKVAKSEITQAKAVKDAKIAAWKETEEAWKKHLANMYEDAYNMQIEDPDIDIPSDPFGGMLDDDTLDETLKKQADAWLEAYDIYKEGQQMIHQEGMSAHQIELEELDAYFSQVVAAYDKVGMDTTKITEVWNKKKQELNAQFYGALAMEAISQTAALMNALADLNEGDFEKQKKYKIASVTLSTIEGAAGSILQGIAQFGFPWGLIPGALGTATAIATGVAQIAKLNQTSPEGNGGGLSAPAISVTPNMTDYTPELNTNLSGFNELTELQGAITDQKVYLIEGELDKSERKRNMKKVETTW